MTLNIHLYDLSCKTILNNTKVFCQISSILPIKQVIGKTKSVPLSNKISFDESFITNNIFMNKMEFIIFLDSVIDGCSQICKFIYCITSNSNSPKSDSKIMLENEEKGVKLSFSLTWSNNSPIQRNEVEGLDQNDPESSQYKIDDFLSFSVTTNGQHQIALIHVSSDQKTLQISCPHFSYSKSIIFQSNENASSVLIDVHKTFPSFQFFFVAIQVQKTENDKIDISFSKNSSLKQFYKRTIDNINSKHMYVPISFSLMSSTNLNDSPIICEIESIDQIFENVSIQNIYKQEIISGILKSRKLDVKLLFNGLLFTGDLSFNENLDALRLFLKHSSDGKIDMSFSAVNESGSLDDTCFFNKPLILNKTIGLSTQKYHCYAEYSMIDLSNISKKITSIIVTLTSFVGKPLSKFNSIEITLTDKNEKLITTIPITIDDDLPGFVVGIIQRNEKNWEFKYVGTSCDCKVPNLAAKSLLTSSCSIDEEVEWKDDV